MKGRIRSLVVIVVPWIVWTAGGSPEGIRAIRHFGLLTTGESLPKHLRQLCALPPLWTVTVM
jgi:hypothetical protein